MNVAVATTDDNRSAALLRAIGLDRLAPEQRELALNIANRYELDLLLKHLVMIEGRPYITRDGLLHIAHRSGVFDGMEATEPQVVEGFWRATCSVFRKDMSHPFTYTGRYPTTGGNAKFAPEMAVKVSEVMAMRRAFDVSAPVLEERWDVEPVTETTAKAPATLADRVAEKVAEVRAPSDEAVVVEAPESAAPSAPPEPQTDTDIMAPEEESDASLLDDLPFSYEYDRLPVGATSPHLQAVNATAKCPNHPTREPRQNSKGLYCSAKDPNGKNGFCEWTTAA